MPTVDHSRFVRLVNVKMFAKCNLLVQRDPLPHNTVGSAALLSMYFTWV